MTDYKYSKPYIPASLAKQLDDRQKQLLSSPQGLDCSQEQEHPILGKNGKPLTCTIRLDPRTNGVVYDFASMRRQEQQEQQNRLPELQQETAQETDSPSKNRGRKR